MQLVPETQFTEQLRQLYQENGKLRKEEENKLLQEDGSSLRSVFPHAKHLLNYTLVD